MEGKAGCREGRAQTRAGLPGRAVCTPGSRAQVAQDSSPGGSELKGDYKQGSLWFFPAGCCGEGLRLQGAGRRMPWTCRRLLTCLCSHRRSPLCSFRAEATPLLLPGQFPLAGPLHSRVAPCPQQLCGQGASLGCAPSPGEARMRGRGRKHDVNRQR